VAAALAALAKQFPRLNSQLFNERQEVNEALNLFVNGEHTRFRGGMLAPLQDGDEVYIVPMITGG
jgi:molybdopterin synthase sulfur carrier subunit